MLDVKKTIVTALKTVQSNVEYELAVQSPTLPLITYKTINDSVNAYGDTLGYSDITIQVKVWTTAVSELAELTEDIDEALVNIGLKRSYYNELSEDDQVIIGVMQYKGQVRENL